MADSGRARRAGRDDLLLESDQHPAVKPFKGALLADGIALTRCAVPDVRSDYARLRGLGVRFTQDPVDLGAGRHGDIRGHLAGT